MFEIFVVFMFPIELTNSAMKYFFSLLFFDNSMTFILNKLFCNGDVDDKRSIVKMISKLRDNDIVVEFNGIRAQET